MELFFKGKEFVYNHHLTIPYRPLVPQPDKSIGNGDLDGNLIIHGDNLHALKALLPRYAGKVDCIFIDPPYNTGNENWCYNDNVNSPIMREWLSSNPVNREDMLRHDKWCAMMWPRLKLLHELLAETGSLWMTLDDNEVHQMRMMLDEIFGEQNFIACCIWHKMDSPKNTAEFLSVDHDFLLVYAKSATEWSSNLLPRTPEMLARYQNPDSDPRGPWLLGDLDARNKYSKGLYPITTPSGRIIQGPPRGKYWRISQENLTKLDAENRIWWGPDGNSEPGIKRFLSEVKDGVVPQTLWHWKDVGSTRNAKAELLEIMGESDEHEVFITPKPSKLIDRVLQIACQPDALILDSFAGSGTTAHAVLEANRKDGGNRRFILVECEDYADTLTAERVRRVMNGYSFTGKHKEEILREKLTWTKFQKAPDLLHKISGLEALHGPNFDRVKKEIKDGELLVYGEKDIAATKPGLGGSFTYCILGQPVDIDALLTGANLPDYAALGAWVFYTATNQTLRPDAIDPQRFYLGESSHYHVWLIYKPDLDFLKSNDSALTLSRAETIAATHRDKKHLVFAPVKFVPNKTLLPLGVEFAQLPYAIYRREQG
jgi:adenine-specific DNA-methyltransferase